MSSDGLPKRDQRESFASAPPRAAALIETSHEAFGRLLDAVQASLAEHLAAWLAPRVRSAAAVSAEVQAAAQAVEALTLRGGKRMRAALVAAAFDAFLPASRATGVERWRPAVPAMMAIELLQTYLLIHDDWMDDDAVRRGGPTVHVVLRERFASKSLGDASAILAGDLACAYAQDALFESAVAGERLVRAARAFAKIQEDVVVGQLAEMCAAFAPGAKSPGVETIHTLKTASYTVTGPLALGALLAGADEAMAAGLRAFGTPLGVAFQLRDDVLGVFGSTKATGKPVGNDIRQGKRTALFEGLDGHPQARAVLEGVFGNPEATDAQVERVVTLIEESGSRARCEARVQELLAESSAALDALKLPPSEGYACLLGAIRALGERAS